MKYRILFTVLLGGCVYYNGMYNANRLARSAKKAEREGRTFEATSLWGQVATKAESVLVRHPTSKYADEAAVLRGVALARMGQCDEALGPLSRVGLTPQRGDLTEEALVATGRCQVALGNLAAADAAFSQLLESKDPERRREAHYQHARQLRLEGRYEEALSTLGSYRESRVQTERILSLAGAGRPAEAFVLADSLIARGDTTRRWDSVVVALGQQDPAAASRLVDRIRHLPGQTPEAQARLLLDDGIRLTRIDTARGARRLREATATGSTGDAPGRASLELVRLDLKRASRPEDLPPLMEALKVVAQRFRLVSDQTSQLGSAIAAVHLTITSVTPPTPQGDLRLFLAAEAARDSLEAPSLAASMFGRILDWWPTSPYAPKVLLAAQLLDTTWVDSARTVLEVRYSDSPYLARIRGEATPEYQHLEDSLGAFAASLAVTPAPAPAGVRRRLPPPEDPVQPGRRPQPATGGTRVPEPE
jgi:tetratricopeptide (TPR) repeat protein